MDGTVTRPSGPVGRASCAGPSPPEAQRQQVVAWVWEHLAQQQTRRPQEGNGCLMGQHGHEKTPELRGKETKTHFSRARLDTPCP